DPELDTSLFDDEDGAGAGTTGNTETNPNAEDDDDDGTGTTGNTNTDGGDNINPPYCATQCLWFRGQPYTDPAELEPPQLGQCPGVLYDIVVLVEGQLTDSSTGAVLTTYQFEAISAPNPRAGPIGDLILPGPLVGGLPSRDWPPVSIFIGDPPAASPLRSEDRFNSLNLSVGNNQVVREISRTITRLDGQPDDCGLPPDGYGPPEGVDPNKWRKICSSNPPITTTVDTNGDRTLIEVFDQSGLIATLDFLPNQVEFEVKCSEEGPPT
ncbi:MAG: hypothetical protein AAFY15_05350, partial [Cyanobacteria bacterium J06648_11]